MGSVFYLHVETVCSGRAVSLVTHWQCTVARGTAVSNAYIFCTLHVRRQGAGWGWGVGYAACGYHVSVTRPGAH